jgi:hypothetical protein
METVNCTTWEGFEAAVQELEAETRALRTARNGYVSRILYRGHRNAEWHLETTLERERPGLSLFYYLDIMKQLRSVVEQYAGKRWPGLDEEIDRLNQKGLESIFLFPTDRSPTRQIISFMAFLRHHGFPSPLLDWSQSTYVAAFFAFEHIDSQVDAAALYSFREHTGGAGEAKDPERPIAIGIGPDLFETSERHKRQQSEYTVCVRRTTSGSRLDSYVFADHEKAINLPGFIVQEDGECCDIPVAENVVTKYTVPAWEQRKVLGILRERCITRRRLFGDDIDNLLQDMWHNVAASRI